MASLEACREHEAVANRDDDKKSDDRGRDAASEEMLDVEVALSGSLVFHHDGSCGMLEQDQDYHN